VLYLKAGLNILLCASLAATSALATPTTHNNASPAPKNAAGHKSSASSRSHSGRKVSSKSKATSKGRKQRGQQAIDSSRVIEIQQALIREHYLTGEATGNWDSQTQSAMQKFQSDQGWQTRLMPDSRALKKLGLGPDYSGAINAAGSSFTPPAPASTIPQPQAAGFAAASGANQ
jgi:peptidoglycan hydrolase-like protein with peptidoglycan-binding domain